MTKLGLAGDRISGDEVKQMVDEFLNMNEDMKTRLRRIMAPGG